jgi:hypothetical protein
MRCGGCGDGCDDSEPEPLLGLDCTKNFPRLLRGTCSSSSSIGEGCWLTVVKRPCVARLAPRLPTRLGTGVGSTRRISSLPEVVAVGGLRLASLTQSRNVVSSRSSLRELPKDRRKLKECSDVGVGSSESTEDADGRRGSGRDQCRQARFSSLSPSCTKSAARVITERQCWRRGRLRTIPDIPNVGIVSRLSNGESVSKSECRWGEGEERHGASRSRGGSGLHVVNVEKELSGVKAWSKARFEVVRGSRAGSGVPCGDR